VGDRELQTAAVQVVALGKALEVTQETLSAAHVFIDVVTANESESVLSAEDTELAEIVHAGILAQGDIIEKLGEDLLAALQTIAGLTDEEVALVQESAAQLPTKSTDDDGVGQYL
jgi:hypothetical protein